MIWQLDLLLFAILITAAILALRARDLLEAVALLACYSLFATLLFAGMGAVDVAFVELALGVGITGLLLIATMVVTGRRIEPAQRRRNPRRWVVLPLIAVFFGVMLVASTDLPDRGDPRAPAHQHVAPDYLEGSLADTDTPNVVTALLADYRSHDTLGETLVIVTSAIACGLILARRRESQP